MHFRRLISIAPLLKVSIFTVSLGLFSIQAASQVFSEGSGLDSSLGKKFFEDFSHKVYTSNDRSADIYYKGGSASNSRGAILFLHGFGVNPLTNAGLLHLNYLAEKEDLALIFPIGKVGLSPDNEKKISWNATPRCCGYSYPGLRTSEVPIPDDESYIIDITRLALEDRNLKIARDKIYIFGFSNGAFMGHTLACRHSELFKGLIAYAGTSFKNPSECRPSHPINILQIHGTKDLIIRYDNAPVPPPVIRNKNQLWFPPPTQIVERWKNLNRCRPFKRQSSYDWIAQQVQPNPNHIGEDILVIDQVPAAGLIDTDAAYFEDCAYGSVGFWTVRNGTHMNLFTTKAITAAFNYIK